MPVTVQPLTVPSISKGPVSKVAFDKATPPGGRVGLGVAVGVGVGIGVGVGVATGVGVGV